MKKVVSLVILLCFIVTGIVGPRPSFASESFVLPKPGEMISLSTAYAPVMIKGLKVHPENPLLFDFIVDTGNSNLPTDGPQLKTESQRLIKYFLAALTTKEEDLWVNLSPYEKDRTIPTELGKTELGRDMLAQDYILKQLTASLIYPEKELGKAFWDKVYTKAREAYGVTTIPVNTFNKVWIVADKAKVLERNNVGYVVGAHLKVMLESDYMAMNKNIVGAGSPGPDRKGGETPPLRNEIGSQIIREIVLPELEHEINQGQNFAPLRQMFYNMILATWYKQTIKNALLNQVYSDKSKVGGIENDDPTVKEKIYQQYLTAYKKGVFNYIKEDLDKATGQTVPRKYFSGGLQIGISKVLERAQTATSEEIVRMRDGAMAVVLTDIEKSPYLSIKEPSLLSKEELEEFKRTGPQFNWEKANEVLWQELIRDPKNDPYPAIKNQEAYFKNQQAVRAEFLRLIHELLINKTMSLEKFSEKLGYMHRLLLLGINENTTYLPPTWPFSETSVGRYAGKFKTSQKKLQTIVDQLIDFSQSKDTKIEDFVEFIIKFYEMLLIDNDSSNGTVFLFERGNNSLVMNFLNAMLRLKGLNGIAHDYFDYNFIKGLRLKGAKKMILLIKEANPDKFPKERDGTMTVATAKSLAVRADEELAQYKRHNIPVIIDRSPPIENFLDLSQVPILRPYQFNEKVYVLSIDPVVFEDAKTGRLFFVYPEKRKSKAIEQVGIYQRSQRIGFDNVVETRLVPTKDGEDYTVLTRIAQTYADREMIPAHARIEDVLLFMIYFNDDDHNARSGKNIYKKTIQGKDCYFIFDYELSANPHGIMFAYSDYLRKVIAKQFEGVRVDEEYLKQRLTELNLPESRKVLLQSEVEKISKIINQSFDDAMVVGSTLQRPLSKEFYEGLDDAVTKMEEFVNSTPTAQIISLGGSPEWIFRALQIKTKLRNSKVYPALKEKIKYIPFSKGGGFSYSDIPADKKLKYRQYLQSQGITPNQIVSNNLPTIIVDYLQNGNSVSFFIRILEEWAQEEGGTNLVEQLRSKLGIRIINKQGAQLNVERGIVQDFDHIPEAYRRLSQAGGLTTLQMVQQTLLAFLISSDRSLGRMVPAYFWNEWSATGPISLESDKLRAAQTIQKITEHYKTDGAMSSYPDEAMLTKDRGLTKSITRLIVEKLEVLRRTHHFLLFDILKTKNSSTYRAKGEDYRILEDLHLISVDGSLPLLVRTIIQEFVIGNTPFDLRIDPSAMAFKFDGHSLAELPQALSSELGSLRSQNFHPGKSIEIFYNSKLIRTYSWDIQHSNSIEALATQVMKSISNPNVKYFIGSIENQIYIMTDPAQLSESPQDAAMSLKIEAVKRKTPGGIDLNAKNMGLDIAKEGSGINVKFDSALIAEFERGDFSGVVPVIIKITPITSLLPLLGLNPVKEEELAKV